MSWQGFLTASAQLQANLAQTMAGLDKHRKKFKTAEKDAELALQEYERVRFVLQ